MRLMPKRMLGVFYLALSAVIFSMMGQYPPAAEAHIAAAPARQ
jgi:hypothetical protein